MVAGAQSLVNRELARRRPVPLSGIGGVRNASGSE
jgi:hypothetical protein